MLALIAVLVILIIVLSIAGWALGLLLSAALVGAVIGGLARLVLPGRQEVSIFATVVLGWIGSLVGGLFGRHVFHVGTLLTIACEVGAAAVLVAIASNSERATSP
jgi:uncharacterized membrane protein YeaQ/YmgE (transglycosylase-associated protein family)